MNANFYWGVKNNMKCIRSPSLEENYPILLDYLNDELYSNTSRMFSRILETVSKAKQSTEASDETLYGEFCGDAMCLEIFHSMSIVSFSVGNLQEEQIDTTMLARFLDEFSRFINFQNQG